LVAGTISRIVNSYGSKWGHVRPDREPRQVFFNVDSLGEGVDFTSLGLGDSVEFEQETDRANGMRAIHMRLIASAPREATPEPVAVEAVGSDE
jgi:hypothetical protein